MHPNPYPKLLLNALRGYHWRGNVRELQNMMHRALLLAGGDIIEAEDIGLPIKTPATVDTTGPSSDQAPLLIGKTVAEVERELILGTLDHCLGNRTHASHILGISIRTLRNQLEGV
ncbi:MAG: helix-turn-helix domain-containing protein [Chitinophagaceae bacterium]